MTGERDIERLLDHWFAQRPTQVSERVLDSVADRIVRERQRPAWRATWRDAAMNPLVKIGAVAAAVVLIAIIGYNLLPAVQPPVGGPSSSAAPTSTPAQPSDSSSPSTLTYDWPTSLVPGTYATRLIWDVPFEVEFTVPDGWQSRDVEITRDSALSLAFLLPGNTYSDPCGRVVADPPTGPTIDDLATALAALPGFDATTPIPANIDGGDARYLELAVRDDTGCPSPGLWIDAPDAYNGAGPVGPPSWGAELPNMRMWILNVDDTRMVVTASWSDSATPADLDELREVVDSVRIVPATGTPIPLPSPE